MKKIWTLLGIGLLLAFLVACDGTADLSDVQEAVDQAQEVVEQVATEAGDEIQEAVDAVVEEVEEAVQQEAAENMEPMRIAIVMPSATTDLAWSQSIFDALLTVQGEMGEDALEIEFTEGMFVVTDAAAALRDYADGGADIVIAHGTQFGTSLFELAPDFPDTAFVYGTSRDTGEAEGLENVFAYDAQAQEGGFINGVIAASLSESGTIGVVGPVEAGDAKLYIDGFVAGATSANPDINVQIAYTGSFGDTALAAEVANTHISAGADVLTGSAQQVVGSIGVAAENGIPWLGTQSDQSPIAEDIVVATQKYDWSEMVRDIIGNVENGVYGGTIYELTLENGGLEMVYGSTLSEDVVAAADAAVAGIISGDIDPTQVSELAMADEEMEEEEMEEEEMEEEEMMTELPEIDPVSIAIVMPSATTDLAWSQSIYDALLNVQSMYPEGTVEIEFTEGMFVVTDAAAALRDYADGGADIVIAHGTQFGTSLFELAPDFPDTAFLYGTSRNVGEEEGLENISAYDAQAQQGGYVNGVIAASLSESGVIGVVGPVEAGDAKLYIDGFVAGAEAANPDVNVQIAYTGSFGDTALAAEVANTHISAGADVLTGSAQQVVGAIGVAAENGVPWLGTQSDQSPIAEEIVVATQKYDWTAMVLDAIVKAQAGEFGGAVYELTLENAGLTMLIGEDLPDDVKAAAEAAIEGLMSGEIVVGE
ncbi:MAG: BMP family protein [Chloroflexota bacterium]